MQTPSHCQDKLTCPNGNCPGCKNGQKWCHDPRCDPDCTDCDLRPYHDRISNIIFLIILIALGVILVALVIGYGPNSVYYYVPSYQFKGINQGPGAPQISNVSAGKYL